MSNKTPYQIKKRTLDDLNVNKVPGSVALSTDAVRSNLDLSKLKKYASSSAAVGTRSSQETVDNSAAYFQGNARRNLNFIPRTLTSGTSMLLSAGTMLIDFGASFVKDNDPFSPKQNFPNLTKLLIDLEKDVSDENFPILHRRDYEDKSVASQMASSEFFGQDAAQGTGFMLGMLVPGAVLSSKGVFTAMGTKLARVGNYSVKGNSLNAIRNSMVSKSISAAKSSNAGVRTYGKVLDTLVNATSKEQLSVGSYTVFQTWTEANLERMFAQETIHNELKNYQKQNKLNPETNKPWTDDEIFEKVKSGGDSVFYSNLVVLGISNTIFNNLLFKEGKEAITKSTLNAAKAATVNSTASGEKVSRLQKIINGSKKIVNSANSQKKGLFKTVVNSTIREGFWEEGSQTMIEARAVAKELEESDPEAYNFISNHLDAYTKMLTTNEGIKSVFLGAVLSLPFSIYGQIKENKQYDKSINEIINGKENLNNRLRKYFDTLYQTDKDGKIVLDEKTQKPILNTKSILASASMSLLEKIEYDQLHELMETNPKLFEKIFFTEVLPTYVQTYLQFDETFEIFESDITEEIEFFNKEQKKKNPNYSPIINSEELLAIANRMRSIFMENKSTANLVYDPIKGSELEKDVLSKDEEASNRVSDFQWNVLLNKLSKYTLLVDYYEKELKSETDEVKKRLLEENIKIANNNLKKIKNISRKDISNLYSQYKLKEKIFDDALTEASLNIVIENEASELLNVDTKDFYLNNSGSAMGEQISATFELTNEEESISAELIPLSETKNKNKVSNNTESPYLKDVNGKVYQVINSDLAIEVDPVTKQPIETIKGEKIVKNKVSIKLATPVKNKVNKIKKDLLLREYEEIYSNLANLMSKLEKDPNNIDTEEQIQQSINELNRRIAYLDTLEDSSEELDDISNLLSKFNSEQDARFSSKLLSDAHRKAYNELIEFVSKKSETIKALKPLLEELIKNKNTSSYYDGIDLIKEELSNNNFTDILEELTALDQEISQDIVKVSKDLLENLYAALDLAHEAFNSAFLYNKLKDPLKNYESILEDLYLNKLVENDELSGISKAQIIYNHSTLESNPAPVYNVKLQNFIRPAINDELFEKLYNELILKENRTEQENRDLDRLKKFKLYQLALEKANGKYITDGLIITFDSLAKNGPIEKKYPQLIKELRDSVRFAIKKQNSENEYELYSYNELTAKNLKAFGVHLVFLNSKKEMLRGNLDVGFSKENGHSDLLVDVAIFTKETIFVNNTNAHGFRFRAEEGTNEEQTAFVNQAKEEGIIAYDNLLESSKNIPIHIKLSSVTEGVFNTNSALPIEKTIPIKTFLTNNLELSNFINEDGSMKTLSELKDKNIFGFKREHEWQNISSYIFDNLPAIKIKNRWMPLFMKKLDKSFIEKTLSILEAMSNETDQTVISEAISYIGYYTLLTSKASSKQYAFNLSKDKLGSVFITYYNNTHKTTTTFKLTKENLEENKDSLVSFLQTKNFNYVFSERVLKGSIIRSVMPYEVNVTDNKIELGKRITKKDYLNSFSDKIDINLKHPFDISIGNSQTSVSNSNETKINYVRNLNATFAITFTDKEKIKKQSTGTKSEKKESVKKETKKNEPLETVIAKNNEKQILEIIDSNKEKIINHAISYYDEYIDEDEADHKPMGDMILTYQNKTIKINGLAINISVQIAKFNESEKFAEGVLRVVNQLLTDHFPNGNGKVITITENNSNSDKVNDNSSNIEKRRQEELKENYQLDYNYVFKNYPKEYFDTVAGKNAIKIFDNTYQERFGAGVANINAKYDAKYVDAVKKGEMTKEQAMQALEEVGRKDSEAYEELAALEPTNVSEIEAKKAEIEKERQEELLNTENLVELTPENESKYINDKLAYRNLSKEGFINAAETNVLSQKGYNNNPKYSSVYFGNGIKGFNIVLDFAIKAGGNLYISVVPRDNLKIAGLKHNASTTNSNTINPVFTNNVVYLIGDSKNEKIYIKEHSEIDKINAIYNAKLDALEGNSKITPSFEEIKEEELSLNKDTSKTTEFKHTGKTFTGEKNNPITGFLTMSENNGVYYGSFNNESNNTKRALNAPDSFIYEHFNEGEYLNQKAEKIITSKPVILRKEGSEFVIVSKGEIYYDAIKEDSNSKPDSNKINAEINAKYDEELAALEQFNVSVQPINSKVKGSNNDGTIYKSTTTEKDGIIKINYEGYRESDGRQLSISGRTLTKEEFLSEYQIDQDGLNLLDGVEKIIIREVRNNKGKLGISVRLKFSEGFVNAELPALEGNTKITSFFEEIKEVFPDKVDLFFSYPNSDGSFNLSSSRKSYTDGATIFSLKDIGNNKYEVYFNKNNNSIKLVLQYIDRAIDPLFDAMSAYDFNASIQTVKPAIVEVKGDKLVLVSKGIMDYNNVGIDKENKNRKINKELGNIGKEIDSEQVGKECP